MAQHVFYTYSPDAFIYDPNTGRFWLDTASDDQHDRNRIEIESGNGRFDPDSTIDVGQTAVAYDRNGDPIQTGKIYFDRLARLQAPDGSFVTIDRVEVDGRDVGITASEPLQPGMDYNVGGGTFCDTPDIGNSKMPPSGDMRANAPYRESNCLAGFGQGTMIQTENGEMPVEWLETSDKILTRDHGYQPILWIARTRMPAHHFKQNPDDKPICVPAGTLGADCPQHDLHVTGGHRVLITSARADALFFSSEVLAPANAWLDTGNGFPLEPDQDYAVTHIACADHQIILAQGAWVETLFAGCENLHRLPARDLARLQNDTGDAHFHQAAARQCITRREATLLIDPQPHRQSIFGFLKQKRSA